MENSLDSLSESSLYGTAPSSRVSLLQPSFTSFQSSSSSSPMLFEGDVIINVSDYYSYPNGIVPSSPWYTTSSTFEATNVSSTQSSSNFVNGDGEDYTLSAPSPLPADFTEISELNKDCIVVYTVLFFLAAVGNLLVLSCVSRHDRLGKSRTPLLIMHLCMADLIVTFFLMPTEIFWRLTIAWKGGDVLCKLTQFIRAFGLYLSSNVVICISVDRYFAIVYPLKLAGAVKRVKWMLVGAWIVSAVFSLPQMFIYHVASHPDYPEFRQCVTKAFLKTGPYNELIYNVSSVAALYFIPLMVIIYSYTMILWKIHQKSREHRAANSQQAAGAETDHHVPSSQNSSVSHYNIPQSNHLSLPSPMITYSTNGAVTTNLLHRSASKRTRLMLRSSANQSAAFSRARSRTLKLTLLIICSQVFLWTPYVFLTLWYMIDRGAASQMDERLQEALFILAVTNSVLNPLIYGTVGRKQDCKRRLHTLIHSNTWAHRLFKQVYCSCCGRCCGESGENTNIESMVMTLNRTQATVGNRNSTRARFGANSGKAQYNHCHHATHTEISEASPPQFRVNGGASLRINRGFANNNENGGILRSRENHEVGMRKEFCVECPRNKVAVEYIFPERSISPFLNSTPV